MSFFYLKQCCHLSQFHVAEKETGTFFTLCTSVLTFVVLFIFKCYHFSAKARRVNLKVLLYLQLCFTFCAETIRSATPFPMVSLFLVFTAFVISNIGHIRPQRTILAFVSGIFFILSGLSLVVGLVLYISSINDEVMNRPSSSEQYFHYRYGWSFAFAASSFLLKEGAGVMSVYLFTKRYAEEEMYRPHPAFYRPRLSDCSDYSGQFLHPEVWHRGRSPSEISSDVSIQMTQNYPPAIKYPDHIHISTSPC
ncbi:hypothetical protein GDO81_013692 [Engystomops pustulosus]|uniref:Voltage-dependent calcium channel gamma-7 subunit n=1 Tax=Engystomops pustulosus TaxID=76066 RepID=A0AAV7B4W2_ENGPU|nr:hypothetical protein GDO81_013692 [Engystomops pustulosus]